MKTSFVKRLNAAVSSGHGDDAENVKLDVTTRVELPVVIDVGIGHNGRGSAGGGVGLSRYKSIGNGEREDVPFFSQPLELKPIQPGVVSHTKAISLIDVLLD